MVSGYRFDPDNHVHWLNGNPVASVTGAMRDLLYDPRKYAAGAADRGTRVHIATELWDLYGEETNDLEALPYLKAWQLFRAEKQFTPDRIESAACNEPMGFAGVIDRIGHTPEISRILVDIKSGPPEPWHAIQTAAYAVLAENAYKLERWGVYLKPDGTYYLHVHPRQQLQADLAIFLSCLSIHNWRGKHAGNGSGA